MTQLAGDASKLVYQSVSNLGPTADTSKTSQYPLAEKQTKPRKGATVMKDTMNTVNTTITTRVTLPPLRTERRYGLPRMLC